MHKIMTSQSQPQQHLDYIMHSVAVHPSFAMDLVTLISDDKHHYLADPDTYNCMGTTRVAQPPSQPP